MKIQKNKDNNISEESKNALKNYKQSQINSNIKFHKIFLVLIVLVNIGLIFFIFFYKSKISEIKNLSYTHTSKINLEDMQIVTQKSSLYKKMVNIASIGSFDAFRFSFIFDKNEQFRNLKKIIYDYRKESGDQLPNLDELRSIFIYQGITDSDDSIIFIEKISYFEGIIIMIHTINGEKFGIFHKGVITPNNKHKFDSDCKDVFLFTLESNKIYKFKGKKNSFHLNKDKLMSLGDDELVIYNNYFSQGGYIDFPLKSFDFSTYNNNILTKEKGIFKIRNIEVFCFF